VIGAHLPALQVILPLLGAPLCMLAHRAEWAWRIAQAVCLGCLAISGALLLQVAAEGEISYAFGGWAAPWGIEYRLDALNTPLLFLVSAVAALVAWYSHRCAAAEIAADRLYLFYLVLQLHLAGLLGVVGTGDVFNLFVFVEIASLSSYALLGLGQDRRALLAAYRYLLLGSLGATFLLVGIGYLYALTGTLNMSDLAERLGPVAHTRTAVMAFAFITVGLALKFALFPLHVWLPDAYTYAPSPIAAFFAATGAKVYLYAWLRVGFTVFDQGSILEQAQLDKVLIAAASLAVLFGSLAALLQRDLRRLLAYSSIAQIGYMVLGASLATVGGMAAALLHLFYHALVKGALFLAVGCLCLRAGTARLEQLRGIGPRMPWTTAALALAALGLVGVPLTAGFVSKWYLAQAMLDRGWWWLALLILGGSLLAACYVWKFLEPICLQPTPANDGELREAPASMLIPLWLLAAAILVLGIDSSLPIRWATRAAMLLAPG